MVSAVRSTTNQTSSRSTEPATVSSTSQTSSTSTEPVTSTSTELPGINIAINVTT